MKVLKSLEPYSRFVYLALVALLTLAALLACIPTLEAWGAWLTPSLALMLGLGYALLFRPVYPKFNKQCSKQLLMYAIIGLGFGLNVEQALASGQEGMLFTVASVFGTMLVGLFVATRLFGLERSLAYLILYKIPV